MRCCQISIKHRSNRAQDQHQIILSIGHTELKTQKINILRDHLQTAGVLPSSLHYKQAHLSFSQSTVTTAGSASCVVMAAQLTALLLHVTQTLCLIRSSSRRAVLLVCTTTRHKPGVWHAAGAVPAEQSYSGAVPDSLHDYKQFIYVIVNVSKYQ